MSTLRVSTIQDTAGSNSSTPAAIANGIAKAWVNFNGTGTVAIRAQYNVSSITDNGVGQYQINFTNALSDANYVMAGNGNPAYAGFMLLADDQASFQTTTQLKVQTRNSAFGAADSANAQVIIIR
jgi:hypothetical protein